MNPGTPGRIGKFRLLLRGELEAPPALRKFGSGWISGVLGIVLGIASLGCVLMMRFPGWFTMPEFAAVHSHPAFRPAVFALLLFAFAFAFLSLVLREGKALGFFGMSATLIAVMLGGSSAQAVVS